MNLSINGQSQVPPGFRFHPTEEELLHYYLRKKVAQEKIDLDVIREVDLNKLEPWDIQEKCRIGSTPQNDWYFFSHKDKKYPTGTRTNRATAAGFWKATGRDKIIYSGVRRIGLRKTLVFYKGRAPHGQKSDWIMHEYRLDETPTTNNIDHQSAISPTTIDQGSGEEGWVVCRVFRKKHFQKTPDHSPKSSSSTASIDSKLIHNLNITNNLGSINNNIKDDIPNNVLDQILLYMGGRNNNGCKIETGLPRLPVPFDTSDSCDVSLKLINSAPHDLDARFMHLPRLECPTTIPPTFPTPSLAHHDIHKSFDELTDHSQGQSAPTVGDWATFDRLVASQLNGQAETPSDSAFGLQLVDDEEEDEEEGRDEDRTDLFPRPRINRASHQTLQPYEVSESANFWSFAKSTSPEQSSDPLRHLSV